MTRIDSPLARLVLRVVYYVAILVAVAVVTRVTGHIETVFVYQGF